VDKTQTIIRELDAIALALAEYNHKWTSEERGLYEEAIALLTS